MDPDAEPITFSPTRWQNSPEKFSKEPDSEMSPQKTPVKVFKFNLDSHYSSSESKKVPLNIYERGCSHSSSRPKGIDELSSFRKKLFNEPKVIRSFSREISDQSNRIFNNSSKEKEIEQLNSKIKHLIKEKYELRSQIENQNCIIQQIRNKKPPHKRVTSVKSQLENSLFEVTFKPKEAWEDPIKKNKRFPHEVFRLPKN